MNQKGLFVIGTFMLAAVASCGTQLTDGNYTGLSAANTHTAPVVSSNLPAGGNGSNGNSTIVAPPPSGTSRAPITCDVNGITPGYLVAHYNANLVPEMELLIASGPANGNAVDSLTVANFLNGATSLPTGTTATVSLSADNNLDAKCDVCVSGTRQTSAAGDYKVLSGTIQVVTPASNSTSSLMTVTFSQVVMEMTDPNNTTTHWCIDQVTATATIKAWSCDDFGVDNQSVCWQSPDGSNIAAVMCNTQNQPQAEGCQGVTQVCGQTLARDDKIHSACNP